MAGGIVAEWYRPDGATVDHGELICRLECEFVAVEIEAEAPGLLHHRRPAGSVERPGAVIGLVLAPGEALPEEPVLAEIPQPPRADEDEPWPAAITGGFEDDSVEEPTPPPPFAPGEPVVVPFRRRPDGEAPHPWSAVPGDAVEFETDLFETAEPLAEAGSAIPGLALWEPDEDPPYADAFPSAANSPEARFSAIAAEAAAEGQVLTMEVLIGASEAVRAVRVLAREWREFTPAPTVEDLVLRAFAMALAESGFESSPAGLTVVTAGSDHAVAIADADGRGIRDAVQARAAGGDESTERVAWTLVSFRECGIRAAEPALARGHTMAAAMGAIDEASAMSVTMAYDSSRLGQGEAARLLARVRSLVEEPYGLLSS
jgi:pyruvate/2-oxoglutarate dehydrogenase complex dihydrolipoamide acyltransferase (E2) component